MPRRLINLSEERLTFFIGEYLDQCYRRHSVPRASEFAASLEWDARIVRRSVKLIYGVTLAALLRRKRIERAAFLLRTTDLTVEVIIRETASGDRRAFFRTFSDAFHMTPSQYRLSSRSDAVSDHAAAADMPEIRSVPAVEAAQDDPSVRRGR